MDTKKPDHVKKFDAALETLTKLLGGEALYKRLKVDSSSVQMAIQELAKEEKDALIKEFKEKAMTLVKSKREFDSYARQQQAEMEKKIKEKQEEFTKQANALFSLMERAENIEESYANTLGAAEEGRSSVDPPAEG